MNRSVAWVLGRLGCPSQQAIVYAFFNYLAPPWTRVSPIYSLAVVMTKFIGIMCFHGFVQKAKSNKEHNLWISYRKY